MVTRVWGKADSFELVFSPLGDGLWNADVPVDLEDGQYIVELYCEDQSGSRAYWTGILYLNNSEQVRVRIMADKFRLWFEADYVDAELESDLHIWFLLEDICTELESDLHIWLQDDLRIQVSYIDHVSGG